MTRTCDTCDRDELKARLAEIESLLATKAEQTPSRPENGKRIFNIGDRVVFRHPRCVLTASDHGTVVDVQPLTVKWDGDIQSRPNPECLFLESGGTTGQAEEANRVHK